MPEKIEFIPDTFYHIYNRGNNRETIFYTEANYSYFLKLYHKYTYKFIDTYSYCLLPNHFHILLKVKSEKDFKNIIVKTSVDNILYQQFKIFFMRYSKSINEQENRVGSLFQKNFKRKPINHDNHLKLLIAYIHTNPLYHSVFDEFENYKWSSYMSIISSAPTKLKRNELLQFFGAKEDFIEFHKNYCDYRDIKELVEIDM